MEQPLRQISCGQRRIWILDHLHHHSYGHFCAVHYLWGSEEVSCGLWLNRAPVSCIKTNTLFSFFQNISPIVYVGIAGSTLLVASLIAALVYRKEEAIASKMWTSQVGSRDLRNV